MSRKQKPKKIGRIADIYMSLIEQAKSNKKAFRIYVLMQVLTIGVFIRSAMNQQWESCLICVLACILFLIPPFFEKNFRIDLPTALEIVVYLFVFCAEILGEIECYYVKYKFWDTMLHTVNGFMFAAFGFCLVDLFNRKKRFTFQLSAGFLALVAFCFSMTIGIMWEFVEYSIDHAFSMDMQKDTLVKSVSSVYLDETNSNIPVRVNDIDKTIIIYDDGKMMEIDGGYLDVGLKDTIKDLFVNFLGAVTFSSIGYIYIKQRGKGVIAASLIPLVESDEDEDYNGPEEM